MKPHLLYPLSEFYQQLGRPLPEARTLQPEEMPETHRRLLVHERDMTPTLEAAHARIVTTAIPVWFYSSWTMVPLPRWVRSVSTSLSCRKTRGN